MNSPLPSVAVSDVLDAAADAHPDGLAAICEGRRVTFSELRGRARSLARGLVSAGVGPGEHIGVWMHNGVSFMEVVYAAAYAKALLVPMNTWHRPREMTYAINQSEISTLIVGADIAGHSGREVVEKVFGGGEDFPHLRTVYYEGDEGETGARLADLYVSDGPIAVKRAPELPSYMLYTSGTTGNAKGVLLDDAASVADAVRLGDRLGLREDDRYYCPVPLFHAGGLIFVLLAAHAHRATVVTRSRFDPAEALEDIDEYGCGVTGGFEVIFSKLVDAVHERGSAPTTLRSAWWVGTAPALIRSEQVLGCRMSNFYGMTEAHGNVSSTPLDWLTEERATNQGIPMAGRAVEVVDPFTEEAVAAGIVGELRVSGWGLMHGYWKRAKETAAKFDELGRLRTGDIGMVDESGRVHFLGRSDDALKVGGENVAPLEIEAVIGEHVAVEEVVVVGLLDARYGHQLAAFVRRRAGADVDPDELREFVRARLASFKVPRTVKFVEEFPRTATGKIRKEVLARSLD